MANFRINDLTAAAALTGAELVEVEQDDTGLKNRKTTVQALSDFTTDDGQVALADGGGREQLDTVAASGATHTVDLADGNVHDVTLTDDCTFTFTGTAASVACGFTLILRQDGTGSRTPTLPASVDWPGGTGPTPTSAANAVDVFTFLTVDNGTTWLGFVAGQDVK